ncbi:MAG TPA: hypothetical protein VFC44_17375 [Candidatus Saccharimonadales bacterium]|nr:hypothetical protein [Candidatus Saccharimonadales bacterium]
MKENQVPHTRFLVAAVSIALAQFATPLRAQVSDRIAAPTADVFSVKGACEYSDDGSTFTRLEKGHIFKQGAILRTGEDARADLFFRRTGTTVRLQPGTEIKIEKMSSALKDGLPSERTLLDLRTGRIFAVVNSRVADSTFEIRNAAGRSVMEGSGIGKYIITADGTHVSAEGSVIPLKLIGDSGITIISPGQQYARKDGKMLSVKTPLLVQDLIQLDELQATSESAGAAKKPQP